MSKKNLEVIFQYACEVVLKFRPTEVCKDFLPIRWVLHNITRKNVIICEVHKRKETFSKKITNMETANREKKLGRSMY